VNETYLGSTADEDLDYLYDLVLGQGILDKKQAFQLLGIPGIPTFVPYADPQELLDELDALRKVSF
jgi:hypothetical protein